MNFDLLLINAPRRVKQYLTLHFPQRHLSYVSKIGKVNIITANLRTNGSLCQYEKFYQLKGCAGSVFTHGVWLGRQVKGKKIVRALSLNS